ncbi:MAG: hypothetical protein ACM3SY_19635 [Candidatus Omnitrophota bacterium]
MKDLNELVAQLKVEISKNTPDESFPIVMKEIEAFYTENFFLNAYEVAILLTNQEKTILSFAYPEYLLNAGMIPVSSTEAVIATIFRTGRGTIDNKFQQTRHLKIFEAIRTPEGKILPLVKMMGALIAVEEEKIGVIEISRRSATEDDAGDDFTPPELEFLTKTITILAPIIKKIMPENFRGKIT